MPSQHDLGGRRPASDYGGAPSPSDIEVECDDCGTTTTADEMNSWDTTTDLETYETTVLCGDCQ